MKGLLTKAIGWIGMGCLVTRFVLADGVVEYQVDQGTYEGYYLSAGDQAPLVMLIHDWDGLTGYEVKRAEMLQALGYSVFAADLFGKGIRPTEVKDKRQHTGALYKDREKMRRLLSGALQAAQRAGGQTSNAVAMGYCFGGAAVLEWARSGESLKGFASFHGGLSTPEGQNYSQTKSKVLVMHGTADAVISMDQFAQLASELEQAKVPHEMVSYGGAPHAFTVFDSDKYREEADQKSWALFQLFLKEEVQK